MRRNAGITLVVWLCIMAFSPSAQAQAKKKELVADGWGTLKGKVTYAGALPKLRDLQAVMAKHPDGKGCCLQGAEKELVDPTWVIDPKTKAVANVVIYLKAPPKFYFPIPAQELNRKDEVVLDQPHCAFLPHVVALFPEYYNGAKMVRTGQKFTIKNSANVLHNANLASFVDQGFNLALAPNTSKAIELVTDKPPVVPLSCNIHPWMSAHIAIFDHPFFTITKEDGTFEIPRVPAGVEVTVMAWHEQALRVLGDGGKKMTIPNEKTSTLDFQVKERIDPPAK